MPVRPKKPAFLEYIKKFGPLPKMTPLAWTAADEAKTKRFLDACKSEGVEPTKRQARAYLAHRGRWARFFNPHLVKQAMSA